MDSAAFANSYDRSIPIPRSLHEHDQGLAEAREWSDDFGQILHDRLNGIDVYTTIDHRKLKGYGNWLVNDFPQFNAESYPAGNQQWSRANELNFHHLNQALLTMWIPVVNGDWEHLAERRKFISISQGLLALKGLTNYVEREKFASPSGDYDYFSEENRECRQSFEGIVNEYDAGIVLLELMKRRSDLNIVPAPRQFERNQHALNADFVAWTESGKAVGVQVKSTVNKPLDYDPEHVVIIDAARDFGNERVMRTQQRSSAMRRVGWAGILCAQRVMDIKPYGPHALPNVAPTLVVQRKMQAREILKGIKPHLQTAVGVVGNRLAPHLTPTDEDITIPSQTRPTVIDLRSTVSAS